MVKVFFSTANILSLFCAVALAGEAKVANKGEPFTKYLANFETNNIDCFAQVNGIPIMDNMSFTKGPSMSGSNVTAFLEKGTNEIRLAAADNDDWDKGRELQADAYCKFTVSANSVDDKYELTNLLISADENLLPTAKESEDYPEKHKTGEVVSGQIFDSLLYEAKRTIHIEYVSKWAWVDATPFHDTPENLNQLQMAYLQIHELLQAQNISGLKKETALAMREWARVEETTPEKFFASLDFKGDFKKGFKEEAPKWGSYEFMSFMGGRLIQLENIAGFSPLVLRRDGDDEGIDDVSYRPFFSFINGKLVIVR